jgi:Protein of unknown function (DUF2637)
MSVRLPDIDLSKISIATCSFAASSLLVNTVAFIGQYGYASEHFGWSKPGDVLYAATIESVAVAVAAHAHQSQKHNDSALRTKLASYALGAIVGALNYSHFASHWHPTAKAVSLGMLSALSPWLWSMFSRRVSRDLFMKRGLLEGRAVKLGATRWFWHPVCSFRAMRWATWRGEQNPAVVIASSGNRSVPEPAAVLVPTPPVRELEPVPEPNASGSQNSGQNQNQNHDRYVSGTGGTGNRELAHENRVPEPGERSVPEPAADAVPEPVTRNREPRRTPDEAAAALVPEARKIIAAWRAEHGRDPITDELRGQLKVSKATACAVRRLVNWQAPDAPDGRTEIAG